MNPNKKAQIRLNETIAVLFIFFVLILFGIIFYYQYQKIAIKEKQEELLASRAMETTLKTLFMPELVCTKGEAQGEDNCLDVIKLNAADETFQKHLGDYYFELFSFANITVQELYPHPENIYYLYNKEKTTVLENGMILPAWSQKESTYFVVSLKNEINPAGQSQYGYGYLKVEVYS